MGIFLYGLEALLGAVGDGAAYSGRDGLNVTALDVGAGKHESARCSRAYVRHVMVNCPKTTEIQLAFASNDVQAPMYLPRAEPGHDISDAMEFLEYFTYNSNKR